MAKTVSYENYRVVIYPGTPQFIGDDDRAICQAIAAAVKRHVDSVGLVHVGFDTIATCEHCGHKWTEESSNYNGGCCEKDQAAAGT